MAETARMVIHVSLAGETDPSSLIQAMQRAWNALHVGYHSGAPRIERVMPSASRTLRSEDSHMQA